MFVFSISNWDVCLKICLYSTTNINNKNQSTNKNQDIFTLIKQWKLWWYLTYKILPLEMQNSRKRTESKSMSIIWEPWHHRVELVKFALNCFLLVWNISRDEMKIVGIPICVLGRTSHVLNITRSLLFMIWEILAMEMVECYYNLARQSMRYRGFCIGEKNFAIKWRDARHILFYAFSNTITNPLINLGN
jgi:hypothetical protein